MKSLVYWLKCLANGCQEEKGDIVQNVKIPFSGLVQCPFVRLRMKHSNSAKPRFQSTSAAANQRMSLNVIHKNTD